MSKLGRLQPTLAVPRAVSAFLALLERSPLTRARTQRLYGVPGSESFWFDFDWPWQAVFTACAMAFTQRLKGVPGAGSFSFDLLAFCCAHTTPSARCDGGLG